MQYSYDIHRMANDLTVKVNAELIKFFINTLINNDNSLN